MSRLGSPQAWAIGRVVIPKRGNHSVGVDRRYAPELGRMINSQVGVGLFLTGPAFSIPVDWHVVLSGKWATDAS